MAPHIRQASPLGEATSFGQFLLNRGMVNATDLIAANAELARCTASLADVLIAHGVLDPDQAVQLQANWLGLPYLSSRDLRLDPRLLAQIDPQLCLKHRLLPLRVENGVLTIACSDPQKFAPVAAGLDRISGHFDLVLTDDHVIVARLSKLFKSSLSAAASSRLGVNHSCRDLPAFIAQFRRFYWGAFLGVLCAATLSIQMLLGSVILLFLIAVFCTTTLKLGCLFARATPRSKFAPPGSSRRPKISILIPIYREACVVPVLVARLRRLTYPKSLLDVVLVLEETDDCTQKVVAQIPLPSWIRVAIVPDGSPRTKPRALNYALDFTKGEVIGIYDAEDLPDPDQLEKVADAFMRAPGEIACVQAALDYYNPGRNWITRCFAIEYAIWFRVVLPGLERIGLPLPLGGTSVFLKRDVLEDLGAWDAHNVTEDADLGIRLARRGYATTVIHSTTQEEATQSLPAWIKQRSRWIKGYLITYLVHMRSPQQLWQDLGPLGFIGVQFCFALPLLQAVLAPLIWSLWLVPLGFAHPVQDLLPGPLFSLALSVLLASEIVSLLSGFIAVSGRAHRPLLPWVPSLHIYLMFHSVAAYVAIFDAIRRPFHWRKTDHGHSLDQPQLPQTAMTRRIQLQPGHKRL